MQRLIFLILLITSSTYSLAFCPTPPMTNNQYLNAQNQNLFYQCLQNERNQSQQQPQQMQSAGAINFGILDTRAPERAANAFQDGRNQRLQQELMEEQLRRLRQQ